MTKGTTMLTDSPPAGDHGSLGKRVANRLLGLGAFLCLPIVYATARYRVFDRARSVFRKRGVHLVWHHYYSPTVERSDLRYPLTTPRNLAGIDFNLPAQKTLISQFRYKEELIAIPHVKADELSYGYDNNMYGPGDAEMLYSIIRHFKPKRIVEIGSGQSTLVGTLAINANKATDPSYHCSYTCVEPFEVPWLEKLGVDVVRRKVEELDQTLIEKLDKNDILFIDSSHVIRPQGDVVCEFLELLPKIKPGVIVHVHDIFTPRDYPEKWVITDQRMWTEQYLLEAFLSFNAEFEVVIALNMLHFDYREVLKDACPVLMQNPDRYSPGAFWFRRKDKSKVENVS